jgi:CPA1 family monovalent cation:H+ antiporter
VLFTILLSAALGGEAGVGSGIVEFLQVFFGGAAIGAVLGLAAAVLLAWLDRNLAAALTVAVAYGSFVLADDVLGFSGVMAGVAAGIVIAGFTPSRASAEVREMLESVWEALGYIANALLFLLIGLAIEPGLITEHLGAIALAIVVVLVARAAAVVPVVSVLERVARIPPVGRRNEAVLIWGGLRGGVALALALALPERLPERDMFVAMTGGVVLATLLLNATTIGALIHRLRLDEAGRPSRFLAAVARLHAGRAARGRLEELDLEDERAAERLSEVERDAREELARIELTPEEEVEVVTRQGLFVERQAYQRLSDAGLLQPTAARTLLHEVDDQIEEVGLGHVDLDRLGDARPPRAELLVQRLAARLPEPVGEDASDIAYSEAMARRARGPPGPRGPRAVRGARQRPFHGGRRCPRRLPPARARGDGRPRPARPGVRRRRGGGPPLDGRRPRPRRRGGGAVRPHRDGAAARGRRARRDGCSRRARVTARVRAAAARAQRARRTRGTR